jgi:hypothetical protein
MITDGQPRTVVPDRLRASMAISSRIPTHPAANPSSRPANRNGNANCETTTRPSSRIRNSRRFSRIGALSGSSGRCPVGSGSWAGGEGLGGD